MQRAWYLFTYPWVESEDKGLSLLRQPGKENMDIRWEITEERMSQWDPVGKRNRAVSPELAEPPCTWSGCPQMEEEGDWGLLPWSICLLIPE